MHGSHPCFIFIAQNIVRWSDWSKTIKSDLTTSEIVSNISHHSRRTSTWIAKEKCPKMTKWNPVSADLEVKKILALSITISHTIVVIGASTEWCLLNAMTTHATAVNFAPTGNFKNISMPTFIPCQKEARAGVFAQEKKLQEAHSSCSTSGKFFLHTHKSVR